MWGRLTPHPRLMQELNPVQGRRVIPTRVAPVGIFAREDGPVLLAAAGEELARLDLSARLSGSAQAIRGCLLYTSFLHLPSIRLPSLSSDS